VIRRWSLGHGAPLLCAWKFRKVGHDIGILNPFNLLATVVFLFDLVGHNFAEPFPPPRTLSKHWTEMTVEDKETYRIFTFYAQVLRLVNANMPVDLLGCQVWSWKVVISDIAWSMGLKHSSVTYEDMATDTWAKSSQYHWSLCTSYNLCQKYLEHQSISPWYLIIKVFLSVSNDWNPLPPKTMLN